MVICRYFQQGTCRYGNSCRNEHIYPNKYTYKPVQQPQKFDPQNSQKDVANLVRSVINDSTCAIKGKQWLLTCYGPFKEKGNFPQFEDYSFEEIRLAMYEAQKLGTTQNHIDHFRQLWGTALQKFQTLLDPNIEIIKVIKDIYYAGSEPQATTTPSFGGNQNQNATNSIFARPQNPPTNTNFTFANNQPPPNTSIFNRNAPTGNSIFNQGFNQQAQMAPIQQQQQQPNIFGGNQPAFAQPSGSIFGGNINPQQNPVFGNPNQFNPQAQQNQTLFGGVQPSNSFGRPLEQPQQSKSPLATFQSQPTGNVFQQPSVPLFNNSPNSFGAPQLQPNVFGQNFSSPPVNQNNPVDVQPNFNQQANVFGGTNQSAFSQQPNQFGAKPANEVTTSNEKALYDESIYSKMEDLSELEINSFNSDNFELGQIPEHPPTIQMC